jgi:hypothetical protein
MKTTSLSFKINAISLSICLIFIVVSSSVLYFIGKNHLNYEYKQINTFLSVLFEQKRKEIANEIFARQDLALKSSLNDIIKINGISMVVVYNKDGDVLDWNGRPTVGMQRALYMHHVGIFWAYFFYFLGFQPVITPPTNSRISKVGIESIVIDTCYPVKISHGHVKELIGRTKYIFLPSMINMATPSKSEVGFYCPMVQSNSYMLRSALGIKKDCLLVLVI